MGYPSLHLSPGRTKMEDAGTLNSVRDVLLRQPDIEFACVFGSFADGRQTPASDIDVAVAARTPIEAQRRLELIDAIASAIGRPVDLVDLHRAGPLADAGADQGKASSSGTVCSRDLVKMWKCRRDAAHDSGHQAQAVLHG